MSGEQLVAAVAPGPPAGLRVRRGARGRVQSSHLAAPVEQGQGHGTHSRSRCRRQAGHDPVSVRRGGPFRRYAGTMPQREDDVAPRSGTVEHRTLLQAGGFALAIAATLAVFLTDNPQFLRLAVVGVAWAFVLATLAAGRRSTDRMAARARESQLRRAYEFELEREVAARREYELELETE